MFRHIHSGIASQNNYITLEHAVYPLTSNILDTVNGYSGTFSRNSIKKFVHDDGTLHSATTSVPSYLSSGILLEPAITNSQPGSNSLLNGPGYGSIYNGSVITNNTTGPDGITVDAMKVTQTSNSLFEFFGLTRAMTSGLVTYISVFFKKGVSSSNAFLLGVYSPPNDATITSYFRFNVSTKTASHWGGVNGAITDYDLVEMNNGWFYAWVRYVAPNNTSDARPAFRFVSDGTNSYVNTDYVYLYNFCAHNRLYNCQVNSGTGSYSAPADTLSLPTTGWNTNNFSFYMEVTPKSPLPTGITDCYIFDQYVDGNNYFRISVTKTNINLLVVVGGLGYNSTFTKSFSYNTVYKILVNFNNSDMYITVNGEQFSRSSPANFPFSGNANIGYVASSTNPIAIVVKNFKFYNTASITYAVASV